MVRLERQKDTELSNFGPPLERNSELFWQPFDRNLEMSSSQLNISYIVVSRGFSRSRGKISAKYSVIDKMNQV